MKIRAITIFIDIHPGHTETTLARAATFLHAATYAFQQAGIVVQSRRIATQPFPRMRNARGPVGIPDLAMQLREECTAYGIDFLSLGPVDANDDPDYVDAIPDMLRAAEGIFASINIASMDQGIDLELLRHTARIIRETSEINPNGFANLYLAAAANCEPNIPFFPIAYHGNGPAQFALAIEAADLVIGAFQGTETPDAARDRLTESINNASSRLCYVAEALAAEHHLSFGGVDFSLAPYPGNSTSLGAGMEQLGVQIGGGGAVGAAALVMNAVEAATFPRCGFSGLMLPVLEDSVLGRRAGEGVLHVNDLLLYSAICGTGLDCIPLPGGVSEEALTAILLDIAALSLRLDKPLTARLMPLPGKAVGDPVEFPTFDYFVPSRVMVPPVGLSAGAFSSSSTFKIAPRL